MANYVRELHTELMSVLFLNQAVELRVFHQFSKAGHVLYNRYFQ